MDFPFTQPIKKSNDNNQYSIEGSIFFLRMRLLEMTIKKRRSITHARLNKKKKLKFGQNNILVPFVKIFSWYVENGENNCVQGLFNAILICRCFLL